MEVITYSLRNGKARSDRYYDDVAAFAEDVVDEVERRLGPLLDGFGRFLEKRGQEPLRSRSEYAFELLTLGVLWRVYVENARKTAVAPRRLLAGLARLRARSGALKAAVDVLRGLLASLFLAPPTHDDAEKHLPELKHLEQLLHWLEATGVFDEEVKRLTNWQAFFADRPAKQAVADLDAAIALAAWFEKRAEAALGQYTPNVQHFLSTVHPRYRWREDAIFCGRRRVEYHLNMVGTEILNRAFRRAFLRSTRKLVLLPPCMQAQPAGRCEARSTPFGARCAGCTPGCRIHQVTKLGEKYGFDVLILPDELSVFSSGAVKPVGGKDIGVVGVSCVLTNITGGWETRDLGIPAQGILLDYCGCSWHWHDHGIPTDINVGRLLKTVGVGQGESEHRDDE